MSTRKPIRVAFDIGGVLSKYPDIMRRMVVTLISGGAEVHVITDMLDHSEVVRQLSANGFGVIPIGRVHCADYVAHGEGCKAELLTELEIDVFLDDSIGYAAAGGCPVRLLVMPDANTPYYADEWQSNGDTSWGRKIYRGKS